MRRVYIFQLESSLIDSGSGDGCFSIGRHGNECLVYPPLGNSIIGALCGMERTARAFSLSPTRSSFYTTHPFDIRSRILLSTFRPFFLFLCFISNLRRSSVQHSGRNSHSYRRWCCRRSRHISRRFT